MASVVAFWDKWFGDDGAEATPPTKEPEVDAAKSAPDSAPLSTKGALARLGYLVRPDETDRVLGDDDVLALLRSLRGSPDQGKALELLVGRSQQARLSDAVLVEIAWALVERGDRAVAIDVLDDATSPAALLFRADLVADAGALPQAVTIVERILARDLDYPGARERHARWRDQLGLTERPRAVNSGATMVSAAPEAPFQIVREVARGGAGVVYEAVDKTLGRSVGLKLYHHPDADREQLLHEVRAAAALGGAGVVRVFDLDPSAGWIALEWVPRGALREALRARDVGSVLPMEQWLLPLARTVARVHAAGWVHNDLKPANVLLRELDDPLLSDFGIARRAGEPSPPGSLGYLSPERIAGRPSDPKDDVFALGRIVEDALAAVADESSERRFRPFAKACTGPDDARPATGLDALAALTEAIAR